MAVRVTSRKDKWSLETIVIGRCPKCRGTIVMDFDYKVDYCVSCLNCGTEEYLGKSLSRLLKGKPGITGKRYAP